MSLVILDIKDEVKGKFLLDFLKQIDFLEIRVGSELAKTEHIENNPQSFEEMLLNAPVLSEEEILNIEQIRLAPQ